MRYSRKMSIFICRSAMELLISFITGLCKSRGIYHCYADYAKSAANNSDGNL